MTRADKMIVVLRGYVRLVLEGEDYRSTIKAIQALPKVGQGTGRHVYRRDNSTVVKAAINKQGIHQNKTEAMCSQQGVPLAATVTKWDEQFRWIEQEYVEGITEKQFEAIAGFSFYKMREAISITGTQSSAPIDPDVKESRVFQDVQTLIDSCNLMFPDLAELEHWGVGRDGALKVRDYGFDRALSQEMNPQ